MKVNVIARLEFELAYYDSEVHRFNHYTTRTPLQGHLNPFQEHISDRNSHMNSAKLVILSPFFFN